MIFGNTGSLSLKVPETALENREFGIILWLSSENECRVMKSEGPGVIYIKL